MHPGTKSDIFSSYAGRYPGIARVCMYPTIPAFERCPGIKGVVSAAVPCVLCAVEGCFAQ